MTVNAAGLSGVTAVVGNVVIASGSTLTLTAVAGSYSAGTTYKILTYTGTESGSFSTVNADFAYLTPVLSYTAGVISVALDKTASFTSAGFASAATTANQVDVANALTRTYNAGGNTLTAALLTASTVEASGVLTQTAGDEAAVFRQVAEHSTGQAQDVIAQRLAAPVSSGTRNDLWVSAAYEHTRVAGDDAVGSSAYQDQSSTLTMGYDRAVNPVLRVGGALAVNDDTAQFSDRSANARVDGAQALLYGSYTPVGTTIYVNGIVGAGFWDNALSRSVMLGTLSGSPQGSFHTTSEAAHVETGLKLGSTTGTWRPYAGLRAGHYTQQGYTESGGGVFDLSYAGANTNAVSSVQGMRFLKENGSLFGHAFAWQADLTWDHRLTGATQPLTAAFADAPAQTYQVFGTPADRNEARLSVAADWQPDARTPVFAKLGAEAGSHTRDYGASVGAQWKW